MSEQIIAILKRKIDELSARGGLDSETLRNALKEELQFYVLNFIYHHPKYGKWVMYGGSALRIIHNLDRMSVDLDFEVSESITDDFLKKLKKEVENYFNGTYNAGADFLTIKITAERGLTLKFNVGKELSLGNPSEQVHVKIDLNNFTAPKTVTERRPINRGQLSFVILTYNMGTLMASKLAAIFLRGTRGVGEVFYEEKGRDIYDLLWYMGKQVVPDFDYLVAKGIAVNDPRALFDKLTIKMNKVSDENLKNDLLPLFVEQAYIKNWLKNWRESYFNLLNDYKIRMVKELENVVVNQDPRSGNYFFNFGYRTEEGITVRVVYSISDYWLDYDEGALSIEEDKTIESKIEFLRAGWSSSRPMPKERLKQYATVFYHKTQAYFRKTNNVVLGDGMATKLIRMTADNFNQNDQIILNKSTLMSCELEDLLK